MSHVDCRTFWKNSRLSFPEQTKQRMTKSNLLDLQKNYFWKMWVSTRQRFVRTWRPNKERKPREKQTTFIFSKKIARQLKQQKRFTVNISAWIRALSRCFGIFTWIYLRRDKAHVSKQTFNAFSSVLGNDLSKMNKPYRKLFPRYRDRSRYSVSFSPRYGIWYLEEYFGARALPKRKTEHNALKLTCV